MAYSCTDIIPIFMKRLYEENSGELPSSTTINFIRNNSPSTLLNTHEDIKKWLNSNSDYFKLKNNGMTVGITSASICDKHCKEPGSCRGGCNKLHICKFFILTKDFKCSSECRFKHDLKEPHNEMILRKYHLQFLNEDELRCLFRKAENRNHQTLPPICRAFNSNRCEKKNCRFLHVCRQFIVDRCPKKGKQCNLRHLIDDKVLALLREYGIILSSRNIPDGLQKLRQMYSATDQSAHTGLLKAESVYDVRTYIGAEPTLETTDRKSNRLYASHSQSLTNVSVIGRSRQPIRGDHKSEDRKNDKDKIKSKNKSSTTGICMNFLSLKNCSNDECNYHHKPSPYQWQYKIYDDWNDFDDSPNKELEERYCHLINEFKVPGRNGFIKYNFENMTLTNLKSKGSLRRLSTPSSAILKYDSNWATVWIWYLQTDSEDWIEYVANNSRSPPLNSLEIEEKYLSNREGKLHFIHQAMVGFIDFKEMFQMHRGKRAVLRRPKPFKWTKVDKIQNMVDFDIFSSQQCLRASPPVGPGFIRDRLQHQTTLETPLSDQERRERRHRSKSHQRTDKKYERNEKSNGMKDFEIIDLKKNDPEFQNVLKKFNVTMEARGATIKGIEAIQNAELWDEYERRKIKMIKKLSNPSSLNEMDLFHGTHPTSIPAISKRGFDTRLSGEAVSIRFGKGSYFTKKADYAHKYIIPDDGIYKMLLAKVLTGHSCKGRMTYARPPLIDPDNKDGELYDSCFDDEENPNVFVIFANDQMFPAYIITYEADF